MENEANKSDVQASFEQISQLIQQETIKVQGDSKALLAILRMLEQIHRNIRDDYFLDTLPANRQALYALLRDIEQEGGWPYIPRFKLKKFLQLVEDKAQAE